MMSCRAPAAGAAAPAGSQAGTGKRARASSAAVTAASGLCAQPCEPTEQRGQLPVVESSSTGNAALLKRAFRDASDPMQAFAALCMAANQV